MPRPLWEHRNSGDTSERAAAIPVKVSTAQAIKTPIYSVAVPSTLAPGDVLQALGEFEVTNPNNAPVGLWAYVVLAIGPTTVTGLEVTEGNGTRVTPGEHHFTMPKIGTWQAPAGYVPPAPTMWVNLVAYAATALQASPQSLVVEQDYGRLSLMKFNVAGL